jgi:hypothetical protein
MSANTRNFGRLRPSEISGGGGSSFFTDQTLAFARPRRPEPLPPPTRPRPFRLDLADVVSGDVIDAIRAAGKMVFHTAGDTGGVKSPEPQRIVVDHMERDLKRTPGQPAETPAFFYMLGDCVYYNGAETDYYPQFYQPYEFYNAPIFAVPGNHDGDPLPNTTSLDGFVKNFCAPAPVITDDAHDSNRTAMTQPNVYWTLLTPLATVIGLYSNVPEGGFIDDEQLDWFTGELREADADKPVFVTMHHPPFSADDFHSGSLQMRTALDRAFGDAGRHPEIVFAGHVHAYERFTRSTPKGRAPYIVAGGGGYWHLHRMADIDGDRPVTPLTLDQDGEAITFERYVDDRHSFMRIEVTADRVFGKCFSVPRPHESWSAPAQLADRFAFDWRAHRLV